MARVHFGGSLDGIAANHGRRANGLGLASSSPSYWILSASICSWFPRTTPAKRPSVSHGSARGPIRDRKAPDGLMGTQETVRRHAEDRDFIETELWKAIEADLTPVVITHHAPSPRYLRLWFEKSRLNASLVSNLDSVIAQFQPPLWIHGHKHDPVDKLLGDTRVIANPLGYSRVEGCPFNPELVLEI